MNLRCAFCQTPFTIGRIEKLDALQHLYAENLNHYDAHCPRCRRATPVPRQKLEMTFPNWQEALKQFEEEIKEHPQPEAPVHLAETEAAPPPPHREKRSRRPASTPKVDATASPVALATKPSAKPATKKPAATSSPKGKKTVAKKSK